MGLILLSTAASISGSVAWFTANRTAKFTAGNFAVVKTSENLVYDLTAFTDENNATLEPVVVSGELPNEYITFNTDSALTHASFNPTSSKLYKAAGDGSTITGVYTVSALNAPAPSDLIVTENGDGNVYAAATWNADFKLSYGAIEKNVGLYIDWNNTFFSKKVKLTENAIIPVGTKLYVDIKRTEATAVTFTDNINDDDKDTDHKVTAAEAAVDYYTVPAKTGKGFRIALIPTNADENNNAVTKVLAKNQTSANCMYLGDVAQNDPIPDEDNYVEFGESKTLLSSGTSEALPEEGTQSLDDAKLSYSFLGNFPFSSGNEVTLSFMCVAWYEGTDPEIVNKTSADEYETMAVELAFSAITLDD